MARPRQDPQGVDVSTLRSASLTSLVEKEIEGLILQGALQPGERLNEFQLAQKFGMSRGPLREALRGLGAKGLVEVIRNRGVFVRKIAPEEAVEIYDLRAALFGLTGRLLVDRLTDSLLAELYNYIETMEQHARNRNFDSYYPVNLAFHNFLVRSTGNHTLMREYAGFVDRLHLCRTRTLVEANGLSVSNGEHKEMVEALGSGNVARTHDAFYRHVERAKFRFITTIHQQADQTATA